MGVPFLHSPNSDVRLFNYGFGVDAPNTAVRTIVKPTKRKTPNYATYHVLRRMEKYLLEFPKADYVEINFYFVDRFMFYPCANIGLLNSNVSYGLDKPPECLSTTAVAFSGSCRFFLLDFEYSYVLGEMPFRLRADCQLKNPPRDFSTDILLSVQSFF